MNRVIQVSPRPMALLTLPLALLVAACGQDGEADPGEAPPAEVIEDVAAAHPDAVSVAFENEYVRVSRFDLPPGEALPAHEGRRRVVYALSDYEIEWTEGDAAPTTRSWSQGDVHVHDAVVHAIRNVGETPASFVVFERLDAALPASADGAPESDDLPAGVESLLAEADLEVLEVELAPGEAQEMHPGGYRAIYSLGDYTLEWREGDEVGERTWSAGGGHWHEPGPHAATNIGDTPARWLIVTFER